MAKKSDPEPVPAEGAGEPQPVQVPPPLPAGGKGGDSDEPQPVAVPPPPTVIKKEEEELEKISLIDETEMDRSAHKKVGGQSMAGERKTDFKREMNITGHGATRLRIFYSRIAVAPLQIMENNINAWIDDEGIDVKHINQTVAMLEGKRAEQNLFILVWF